MGNAQMRLHWLEGERERLQAIVDKLPKTADGVPAVPGMRVFRHVWPTTLGEQVLEVDGQNRVRLDGQPYMYDAGDVSSTREAAEAPGVDDDPADTAAGAWLETLLGRAKIKQTATDPAAAIRCAFRTGYLIGQRAKE